MLNTGLQPRTERSEAPRGCNSTRKASNRTEFSINRIFPAIQLGARAPWWAYRRILWLWRRGRHTRS